jgi:hypothetical protein
MVKLFLILLIPIIALSWFSGMFNNIFSEYQRHTNYYAMVIHNEQDDNNFYGNVTQIMNTGNARFVGGFSGCGFREIAYQNKKTNVFCFWE